MNEDPGVDYFSAWSPGDTIIGLGGIGIVIKSNHPDYAEGDLVEATAGWPWLLYFEQDPSEGKYKFTKVIHI